MRLNKSTSHAIRILIDCAETQNHVTKVAALSGRLGISQQNVFKIVNILARAELILATRGRNGGVRLARPAKAISVGEIVRAMETTEFELDLDGNEGTTPGRSVAQVNRLLDGALDAFIEVLDNHTLADLIPGTRNGGSRPASRSPRKSKLSRAAIAASGKRVRSLRKPA